MSNAVNPDPREMPIQSVSDILSAIYYVKHSEGRVCVSGRCSLGRYALFRRVFTPIDQNKAEGFLCEALERFHASIPRGQSRTVEVLVCTTNPFSQSRFRLSLSNPNT